MACFQPPDRRAFRAMPPASVLAKRAGRSSSDSAVKNSSKASIQFLDDNLSDDSLVEPKGRRARLSCHPKRARFDSTLQCSPVDFESLPPAVRRKVSAPRLP